jgi:hypothetical protein
MLQLICWQADPRLMFNIAWEHIAKLRDCDKDMTEAQNDAPVDWIMNLDTLAAM